MLEEVCRMTRGIDPPVSFWRQAGSRFSWARRTRRALVGVARCWRFSPILLQVLGLLLVSSARVGAAATEPALSESTSPLGGARLLRDEPCIAASSASAEERALLQTSRELLLKHPIGAAYFDQHYCAISTKYEYSSDVIQHGEVVDQVGHGWAWVTYKVTFAPYLAWWQHHFPVVVGADKRPQLQDGAAIADLGRLALVPQIAVAEIHARLRPKELQQRIRKLIGNPVAPLQVLMGPMKVRGDSKEQIRLYVSATSSNPKTSSCSDTNRIGTVDIETGEAVVSYTGVCEH